MQSEKKEKNLPNRIRFYPKTETEPETRPLGSVSLSFQTRPIERPMGSEIAKSRGAKAVGSLQSKDERPNSAN
ncbi:hypothetical protein Q4554_18060, partial [Leptospira santarosai]|nr:hypothetical protein [Leptospira santarosai]